MSLQHRSWPTGDFWSNDEVACWAGSVRAALETLPKGEITVWGGEGVESWVATVAEMTGHQVGNSQNAVLDLIGLGLTNPKLLIDLSDEASVAMLIHPALPVQSFDFYSSIHRYSLSVSFTLWGSAEPLEISATVPSGDWALDH